MSIIVRDSNMLSDDEMYIYIDVWGFEDGEFNSSEAYEEYLLDYKRECDSFIERLKKELPKNIGFSEMYTNMSEYIDDDNNYHSLSDENKYYECCELHFKIVVD